MPSMIPPGRKALVWIGSSKDDLRAMPVSLQKEFGVALDIAQQGQVSEGAKPLKGKQKGAVQLSEDHDGDTYRAVYTAEYHNAIYVLHCFQKKSKKGIATPKPDLDLIARRLKRAREIHADLNKER